MEIIECEVCSDPVKIHDDRVDGVVIEFRNLTPEYVEHYGFCPEHIPGDIEDVKRRIKQGRTPIPPTPGDRVAIYIPDRTDPDCDTLAGRHGTVVDVIQHDEMYRVQLDDDETRTVDISERNLRRPID